MPGIVILHFGGDIQCGLQICLAQSFHCLAVGVAGRDGFLLAMTLPQAPTTDDDNAQHHARNNGTSVFCPPVLERFNLLIFCFVLHFVSPHRVALDYRRESIRHKTPVYRHEIPVYRLLNLLALSGKHARELCQ